MSIIRTFIPTVQFEQPWGNYLLDKLVETTAPEAISWLPQTLGWKIIFTALIFYTCYKAYLAYKKYKRNVYRRNALAWIKHYQTDEEWFYRQLPSLLRKTAITAFDRAHVTSLMGNDWEKWLDAQCKQSEFSSRCSTQLHQLAFSPDFNLTPQEKIVLVQQISTWIKFHRRQHD
ncbi:DUF4381 domain-containing protein [Litorilituus lipolyticus]|uniref:DUF4381 domain-containing protein n=1 Tax=Litorilituus lipolyticus TaxID=2491017 RepID=A0A502L0A2_9GAMM|nr:DUF4381 domain-containing protein [Litorilituus lipolyticus]TPH15905.1 DUF4381 domain-containing protein [Litorilituus lipolyticus]